MVMVVMVMVVTAVRREELFVLLISILIADVSDFNLLLRFDIRDGLNLHDDSHKKEKVY